MQQQAANPPLAATTPAQAQARDTLLRSKMDMILNHLRRDREERRRDMETIYAALAARDRGSGAIKGMFGTFWQQALTVVATVVATYLVQKYVITAFEKRSEKQATAIAREAAMRAAK